MSRLLSQMPPYKQRSKIFFGNLYYNAKKCYETMKFFRESFPKLVGKYLFKVKNWISTSYCMTQNVINAKLHTSDKEKN